MAAHYGAMSIYMLGYDCGFGPNGEKHWHGDHPKGLGNAGMLAKWPQQFRLAEAQLRYPGRQVLNASRVTSLDMFPRVSLDTIVNYD